MADRLADAIAGALLLDPAKCVAHASQFTWRASADQFLASQAPFALQNRYLAAV